jgi:hypothetical protein
MSSQSRLLCKSRAEVEQVKRQEGNDEEELESDNGVFGLDLLLALDP